MPRRGRTADDRLGRRAGDIATGARRGAWAGGLEVIGYTPQLAAYWATAAGIALLLALGSWRRADVSSRVVGALE
jgi:hypothetical protein